MNALSLDRLETPCLLLDEERMAANIARLKKHLAILNVPLRPHLKTAKSLDVARLLMQGPKGPITVSTIREAEYFAEHGVCDILYAVGITRNKLERASVLRKQGVDLSVVVDSIPAAQALVSHAREIGDRIPALIEIDADGHRSGVRLSDSEMLVEIGRLLHEEGILKGVMTHAGDSYACRNMEALVSAAEQERAITVACAQALRVSGLPCSVVSIGSTPTAHAARDLTGITEVRAGVFVFFDLVMAGVGVCSIEDIALSVLATIIGRQHDRGWIIVDAGWMAMSRDRGTGKQQTDQGYGLVCDLNGDAYPDMLMLEANQEHGILGVRPGSEAILPNLRIGDLVRILPNHACATAAQHDVYNVIMRDSKHQVQARWTRFRGW
jgi:D-serine deaminase-like pyridoxal phosphate-dependent protein